MTIADLYDGYEHELRGFALKLCGLPELADDLVQDTFIRCMGHLPLLEQLDRRQCRAWLYQTLKNRFLDQRSARQREQEVMARFALETSMVVEPEPGIPGFDPFDLVPEGDRELIEKRYRLGLSSKEIAHELGVPAATVRYRLHLAVKRLRARKKKFT